MRSLQRCFEFTDLRDLCELVVLAQGDGAGVEQAQKLQGYNSALVQGSKRVIAGTITLSVRKL